jgi:hypothetical protein
MPQVSNVFHTCRHPGLHHQVLDFSGCQPHFGHRIRV